jgi:hypothetical protein
MGTSYSWNDLVQLRQDLVDTLDEKREKDEVIKEIDAMLFRYLYFDYFSATFDLFRRKFDECHDAELADINREFGSPVTDTARYTEKLELWRRKRESIDRIKDAGKLAKDRKLGREWKRVFETSMETYGACLRSKLPEISKIETAIGRLIEIERLDVFDARAIDDVFKTIATRTHRA